jgi:hypothetical protein
MLCEGEIPQTGSKIMGISTVSINASIFPGSETISRTLQYVDLSVVANNVCEEIFEELITDTKICVSTNNLKSPCNVSISQSPD